MLARRLSVGLLAIALAGTAGCGGSASARNITCSEVSNSTAKTEAVAKELVAAIKSAGGKVESPADGIGNVVSHICEIGGNGSEVKPGDKAFAAAVGEVWHEQENEGEPPESLTK